MDVKKRERERNLESGKTQTSDHRGGPGCSGDRLEESLVFSITLLCSEQNEKNSRMHTFYVPNTSGWSVPF